MILNLFKYSKISCSLDGIEEDKFWGFEVLENGGEIVEIEEVLNQDDEY